MNWTTNRYRVKRDDDWITTEQAFVCTCWSVLFALFVVFEAVAPAIG